MKTPFFTKLARRASKITADLLAEMRGGILFGAGFVLMAALGFGVYASNPYSWKADTSIQNISSGTILTHTGWNIIVNNEDYLSGQLATMGNGVGGTPGAFQNLKIVAGGTSIAVTANDVAV